MQKITRLFIKIAAVSLTILTLAACREDDDAVITGPIEGQWKGTHAEIEVRPFGLPLPFKEDDDSFAIRMQFAAGGTLTVWDRSQPIEGTYALAGDQLTIETDYTLEDIKMAGLYIVEILTDDSLVIYTERDDQVIDADGAPAVNADVKVILHFARD